MSIRTYVRTCLFKQTYKCIRVCSSSVKACWSYMPSLPKFLCRKNVCMYSQNIENLCMYVRTYICLVQMMLLAKTEAALESLE